MKHLLLTATLIVALSTFASADDFRPIFHPPTISILEALQQDPVALLICGSVNPIDVSATQIFDSFGDICCNDEKAHLDNFAIALQSQPDSQGYIIFYGGRRQSYPSCQRRQRLQRCGDSQARAARLKPYLVNLRGLDPGQVIVIDGGYRESWTAEFWIVPRGATPPAASPTVQPNDIRYRKGRIKKRDYECQV